MESKGFALAAVFLVVGMIAGFISSGYSYVGSSVLQPRLSELMASLDEARSKLSNAKNELSTTRSELTSSKSRISFLESSLANTQSQLADLKSRYDALIAVQPKIALVDVTKYPATVYLLCMSSQRVGADFWLVNTGRAHGIALIRLTGGGQTLAENSYLVPAGQSIQRSLKIDVGCTVRFEVDVSIVEVKSG